MDFSGEMELKACRGEFVEASSSFSSGRSRRAGIRAAVVVLPRRFLRAVCLFAASAFRLDCRSSVRDRLSARRCRTRTSRGGLCSARADSTRCFLFVIREWTRFGGCAAASRVRCLRVAWASDSGPALREADGRGRLRIGLPAGDAIGIDSRARATVKAAARLCIFYFLEARSARATFTLSGS